MFWMISFKCRTKEIIQKLRIYFSRKWFLAHPILHTMKDLFETSKHSITYDNTANNEMCLGNFTKKCPNQKEQCTPRWTIVGTLKYPVTCRVFVRKETKEKKWRKKGNNSRLKNHDNVNARLHEQFTHPKAVTKVAFRIASRSEIVRTTLESIEKNWRAARRE